MAQHPRVARVGLEQRREHPDRRRLPGTVRPENAVHGASANREVDAIDGDGVTERLDEAARLDCEVGL